MKYFQVPSTAYIENSDPTGCSAGFGLLLSRLLFCCAHVFRKTACVMPHEMHLLPEATAVYTLTLERGAAGRSPSSAATYLGARIRE